MEDLAVCDQRHQGGRHDHTGVGHIGDAQVDEEHVSDLGSQTPIPPDADNDQQVAQQADGEDKKDDNAQHDDCTHGTSLVAVFATIVIVAAAVVTVDNNDAVVIVVIATATCHNCIESVSDKVTTTAVNVDIIHLCDDHFAGFPPPTSFFFFSFSSFSLLFLLLFPLSFLFSSFSPYILFLSLCPSISPLLVLLLCCFNNSIFADNDSDGVDDDGEGFTVNWCGHDAFTLLLFPFFFFFFPLSFSPSVHPFPLLNCLLVLTILVVNMNIVIVTIGDGDNAANDDANADGGVDFTAFNRCRREHDLLADDRILPSSLLTLY